MARCNPPIMIFTVQKQFADRILSGEKKFEIRGIRNINALVRSLGLRSPQDLVGGTVFIYESGRGRKSIVAVARISRVIVAASLGELESRVAEAGYRLGEDERRFVEERYAGNPIVALELSDVRLLDKPIHYTDVGSRVFETSVRGMQWRLRQSLIPLRGEEAEKLCRLVEETNPGVL